MIKLLALCAAYNRRDTTIASLRALSAQVLPPNYSIDIAVVDDLSSDGTFDHVKNCFPDVFLTQTAGNLYWAGSMRLGYEMFWGRKNYELLLVFNDDIKLYPDSLYSMIEMYAELNPPKSDSASTGTVIVGSFHDGTNPVPTYGGYLTRHKFSKVLLSPLVPNNRPQRCDTFNMNFALIDRFALNAIGFIPIQYVHGFADFDFGFRLRLAGGICAVMPGFQGICERNATNGTWEDPALSFSSRFKLLLSPKGLDFLPRYFYLRKNGGILWPILFIWPYIRFMFVATWQSLSKR